MAKLQELNSCIKRRKYLSISSLSRRNLVTFKTKPLNLYRVVNKYYISYKHMLYKYERSS